MQAPLAVDHLLVHVHGSWTSPKGISRANCDGNHQVQSYGVYYR